MSDEHPIVSTLTALTEQDKARIIRAKNYPFRALRAKLVAKIEHLCVEEAKMEAEYQDGSSYDIYEDLCILREQAKLATDEVQLNAIEEHEYVRSW